MDDEDNIADKVYEAAFVPELWPEVLDAISKRTESAFGTLFTYREGVTKFVGTEETVRVVSEFLALNQPKLNSRIDAGVALNSPGFITDHDMFTDEQMACDPFYVDFMYPRGYGWVAATYFPLPTGDTAFVSFERQRVRGPFERNFVAMLDNLRPHLGRSAVLSTRMGLKRAQAMTQALHAVGIPSAVLNSTGGIYVANDLFQKLIPAIVLDRRQRATLADVAADALLEDAIARQRKSGSEQSRSIPVAAEGDRPPYIFHLVPIRGAARDVFASGSSLLIATPIDKGTVPTAEVLQGLFDLTPAEARVARGIAEGKTIDALALASAVSRETVRTQLGAVLAKTGLNRQAELVALLSGAALPG
jgi:DNA-binding CsgD family transcriptional regulator